MPTTIRLMLWGPVANSPLAGEHPQDHVEIVRVFADDGVSEEIPTAAVVETGDGQTRVRKSERILNGTPHTGYSIMLAVKIEREPSTHYRLHTLECQVESAVCDALLELVPVLYVEFVTSQCEGYSGGSPDSPSGGLKG